MLRGLGKQCYHCQGLGHVQADCPTLRLSGTVNSGRCYSCGQTGHLARNCPAGNMGIGRGAGSIRGGFTPNFARAGYGGQRPATCYKCGGTNRILSASYGGFYRTLTIGFRTKSLCQGLPTTSHEMLCLRKIGSYQQGL